MRISAAYRSMSIRPSASTGTMTTSKPSLSRTWQTPPTAGCSAAPITTRVPSSRIARTPPQIASATDSVPPDVNTSSSGCAWIERATTSRASSMIRRAARPGPWMFSGSPNESRAATKASRAAGKSGVADAASR